MNAHVDRTDLHCEEVFARPAFSQLVSFAQIVEPIYDAFDAAGFRVPADALRVQNGDSIATAKVSMSLLSGRHTFEARLDGCEAHFYDLQSREAIDHAAQVARLFCDTICNFLSDGVHSRTVITARTWLTVDGGQDSAENIVRSVASSSESNDPFQIGAHTVPAQATFTCRNQDANWIASITIAKSQLPDSNLFLETALEYEQKSTYGQFADKAEHVEEIWRSVTASLGLTVN